VRYLVEWSIVAAFLGYVAYGWHCVVRYNGDRHRHLVDEVETVYADKFDCRFEDES
jgi:hypothetical protein